MHTTILSLAIALLPATLCAQSLVTEAASPGTRNTSYLFYDESFLFVARDYGNQRDAGGNTEAGMFVHSKVHDCWLQLLQVPTKDAKFGKSQSDDPKANARLRLSQVGWDFTRYAKQQSIELPLKTESFIAFPVIDFDPKQDRYRMSFHTSWEIESAATRLYLSRQELTEQFDKLKKQ